MTGQRLIALETWICFVFWIAPALAQSNPPETVLEASDSLHWYKGNLHAHSNWSDGDDYLECVAKWYHDRDYQFLAITDHNVMAQGERWIAPEVSKGGWVAYDKLQKAFPGDWIVTRRSEEMNRLQVRMKTFQEVSEYFNSPGKFLLLPAEEISDQFSGKPIHLNASNLTELITPRRGNSVTETIQNNVDAVLSVRERTGVPVMVHLNHPNFHYAVAAEDLMPVIGEKFFEVYNGHPQVHNLGDKLHAGTERIWDIVNSFRLGVLDLPVMYGLGVDDGHDYHDRPGRNSKPGRGWVQVLAPELAANTLVTALEAGRFYASSGVVLKRIESSNSALTVVVDPAPGESYIIEFVGTLKNFDRASQPTKDDAGKELSITRTYSSDIGRILSVCHGTQASYRWHGDELYVRARITSSAAHANPSEPGEFKMAWTQPIVLTK